MKISSPKFGDGEEVPIEYTCEGGNISPPLEFSDIPKESKSLSLIVTDPDAPANPWVHWVVFNIPADTKYSEEGELPKGGVEGIANGGTYGYEGPCPPEGSHRYVFKLYALNKMLDILKDSDRNKVLAAMEGNIVGEAELIGFYRLKDPEKIYGRGK